MTTPMMKCGHAAQGTQRGRPVCVICLGIYPTATEIDTTPPSMLGRKATCDYCHKETDSSPDLAFFKYRPECKTDDWYCGCLGWN